MRLFLELATRVEHAGVAAVELGHVVAGPDARLVRLLGDRIVLRIRALGDLGDALDQPGHARALAAGRPLGARVAAPLALPGALAATASGFARSA